VNYTVKAAARATGISESRLRTWERRYGIPHPGRGPSGRRLYNEDDLALIRRMASLVDAGMSAAQAAEAARSGEPIATAPAAAQHELVAVITAAAERYEEAALVDALRGAVLELGWPDALKQVIFPALKRVGVFWETAVIPPASEHFTSELVRRELVGALNALPAAPEEAPLVLLACPEDERHDLGLAALALLLHQRGLRTVYLGADVPTPDLLEAIAATAPDAVCLAATSSVGLASLVRASRALVSARRLRLFIGGPATAADGTEAAGIQLPTAIDEAAEALASAVRRPS
jgi:DNA-binding transcriptional MerR regulator/methylmalonyl-CoA mutase cobalamin-binding subunit